MKSLRIILLVMVSLFVLCSSSFSAPKTIIPIYTPGAGGTAYLIGGAMASCFEQVSPGSPDDGGGRRWYGGYLEIS